MPISSPFANVIVDEPSLNADPNSSNNPLTRACPCGPIRYSRPPWPYCTAANAKIARQRFRQYRNYFQALGVGSTAYFSPIYILVEETEGNDVGAGIVEWDRVWATVPSNFGLTLPVTKTYQYAIYTRNGAQILAFNIVSYSRTLSGAHFFQFYQDSSQVPPHVIPPIPFIATWTASGTQFLSDFGSGFPHNGATAGDWGSNEGFSIVSGTIENYMGNIMYAKLIYAGY